jgi:hypothetical protein
MMRGLVFAALSCSPAKRQQIDAVRIQGGSDAVLKIDLPIIRIHPEEFIAMQVSLVNASSHDLWVNGRLLLNREDYMPAVRDFWLIMEGPDGKDVPLTCYKKAG